MKIENTYPLFCGILPCFALLCLGEDTRAHNGNGSLSTSLNCPFLEVFPRILSYLRLCLHMAQELASRCYCSFSHELMESTS